MSSLFLVDQYLEGLANFLLVEVVTDLFLYLHQLVGTGLLFFL